MKYVKNEGEKVVSARALKGHWYTFKKGELLEVEDEDVKHIIKREGMVEASPSKEDSKKLETKKEEKKDIAEREGKELKEAMESARGKIRVKDTK